ncbi:hypothetical protein [Minwuia thermotolerans]|uniref:Uncharacterized protein n=1 Tax=Minwuia thermotolerans TaxID=2056226 RepID=A0A2M9G2K9_9PROT|nr:hypothetical protein [Minwuia thermotolerans]PJK29935.1 hypothetical protein CVT23_09205 [Minwuia thermotolerans]
MPFLLETRLVALTEAEFEGALRGDVDPRSLEGARECWRHDGLIETPEKLVDHLEQTGRHYRRRLTATPEATAGVPDWIRRLAPGAVVSTAGVARALCCSMSHAAAFVSAAVAAGVLTVDGDRYRRSS